MAQLDDVPPTKNIPELGQLVDIRILDDYGCTVDLQILKLLTSVDVFFKKFRSITVDHTRSSKYVIQNLDTLW